MIKELTIVTKLEKLKEYAGYLKGYQKLTLEDIRNDHTLQGAILHYLQLSIESIIDIGEVIISEHNLRKPKEAREVFKILAEKEIIPLKFSSRLALAAGFRNLLVHEYAIVDLKKAYSHLHKDLSDFDLFARYIAKFLKGKKLAS